MKIRVYKHLKNKAIMCTVQTQSFSGPCFLAFGLNTEKYEPKKFPHLDIFREVPPLRITFYIFFQLIQNQLPTVRCRC